METLLKHFGRKAILSASLLSACLLMTHCSKDALDIKNPNQLSQDSFWRSADDAEKGLVAVYGPLTTIMGFGRMMGAILTTQRGDEVNPYPSSGVQDPGTLTVTSTDGRVSEGWGELNAIVSRANQVIDRVPTIQMDETRKAQIVGEAYFLRALAHFYLLNMWGNIPLVTKPVNTVDELFVTQATQTDVWASIKSDLKQAQSKLPAKAKDLGRATSGAATALLGKAYLYTKEWGPAAAEFKKLIDLATYDLTANYQDNFLAASNNNKESLFELQYQSSSNGNWGPSGTPNPLRGQGWEQDIAPKGYTPQGTVSINQWVLDLFLSEKTRTGLTDPRAYATIVWNYPGAKVYQDDFTKSFSGSELTKVWARKYLNFERINSSVPGAEGYSTNNLRIIRFADVLLMYAEAENEANGPTTAAYQSINRVRARATMPDIKTGLTKDDFRTAVRSERVLELALEGTRIFDLNRWGITADVFAQHPEYRSNSKGVFQKGKHEYLPIPQNDIGSNPKLKQNPGY
ncbi:RagB/SusD family nutrient uptake outer membrane protein [Spirosoma arcticum]